VFLQRVIAVLGRSAVGGAALADLLDRRVEALRRDAGGGECLARRRLLRHRQREQQALDRDKAVAGLLGNLLRLLEDARQFRAHINLASAATLDLWLPREFDLDRIERCLGVATGGV